MLVRCSLDDISGIIPPYLSCMNDWEEIMLDRILTPLSTTAAVVSSQEVSMPKIFNLDFLPMLA
jgi:hypothetical protein